MVKLFLMIITNIIFMLGIGARGGGTTTTTTSLGRYSEIIDHPNNISCIRVLSPPPPPLRVVIFEVEFKVDGPIYAARWERYLSFIESLRSRLGAGINSHGLPVLPPQQDPPTEWFDIILRTNRNSIRFRIRRDNLYVDGYRIENPVVSQWFEFARDGPRLIPGSTFLRFGGDYGSLDRFADEGRATISLGQQSLVAAIFTLANITSTDQERAHALTVVIQMTSESIRFARISEYLTVNHALSQPPPTQLTDLENSWGTLSAGLLRTDADPTYRLPISPQLHGMGIDSILDAIRFFGIILYACTTTRNPNGFLPLIMPVINNNNSNEVVLHGGQHYCGQGEPLVEVFSVRINNIDGEKPGDLYGTIGITDGLGSQYIYNTKREDSQSIYPGATVLLIGPTRSISAYGSFSIDVALMDKDTDLSPDDEVSRGIISWNVYDMITPDKYNTITSVDVNGRYGSATVTYIVVRDAVEANVEVTLINGDGENPADVYGSIQAGSFTFGQIYWGVLFMKTAKEDIDVRPGQLIPLSRSVIAVNRNSSLKVSARLYDRDRDLSPDDEIADGIVDFPPQLSGTSVKNIRGKYGEIQVKVTWASP